LRILIVGAGAVGQVYARHLAAAGHDITFFVKPAHVAGLANGLPLHRLGHFRMRSETWRDYRVISALADETATAWDQVWLCVASDALRSPLASDVLARVGRATVVCLQPGPEDGDRVKAQVADPDQVVQGLITFISYQSPLPGRPGPDGMAYYLPAVAPGLFGGEAVRTTAVVQALKKGGMAARRVDDLDQAAGGSEGVLIPLIAALEQHDWRLSGLSRSTAFARGRAAAREAVQVLAASRNAPVRMEKLLLSKPASALLLFLAPKVLPLELEPYLKYHFSKVGVQTRQMLDSYIRIGDEQELPVGNLRQLLDGLS
jgi:2-dehydropantoate 2-reductase